MPLIFIRFTFSRWEFYPSVQYIRKIVINIILNQTKISYQKVAPEKIRQVM